MQFLKQKFRTLKKKNSKRLNCFHKSSSDNVSISLPSKQKIFKYLVFAGCPALTGNLHLSGYVRHLSVTAWLDKCSYDNAGDRMMEIVGIIYLPYLLKHAR